MSSQNLTLVLAELQARMVTTGNISDKHRRVLSEALSSPSLEETARLAIDRLLVGTAGDRIPHPQA